MNKSVPLLLDSCCVAWTYCQLLGQLCFLFSLTQMDILAPYLELAWTTLMLRLS